MGQRQCVTATSQGTSVQNVTLATHHMAYQCGNWLLS